MSQKKRVRIYKAGGQQGQYINPTAKWMMQMGGQGQGQDEQIQQLIMMYAQIAGVTPEEIIAQLQQAPPEQQQQMMEQMMQAVQQAQGQQQMMQMGGSPEMMDPNMMQEPSQEMMGGDPMDELIQMIIMYRQEGMELDEIANMILDQQPEIDEAMLQQALQEVAMAEEQQGIGPQPEPEDQGFSEEDLMQKGGVKKLRKKFVKEFMQQGGMSQGAKDSDVSEEKGFGIVDKISAINQEALMRDQAETLSKFIYPDGGSITKYNPGGETDNSLTKEELELAKQFGINDPSFSPSETRKQIKQMQRDAYIDNLMLNQNNSGVSHSARSGYDPSMGYGRNMYTTGPNTPGYSQGMFDPGGQGYPMFYNTNPWQGRYMNTRFPVMGSAANIFGRTPDTWRTSSNYNQETLKKFFGEDFTFDKLKDYNFEREVLASDKARGLRRLTGKSGDPTHIRWSFTDKALGTQPEKVVSEEDVTPTSKEKQKREKSFELKGTHSISKRKADRLVSKAEKDLMSKDDKKAFRKQKIEDYLNKGFSFMQEGGYISEYQPGGETPLYGSNPYEEEDRAILNTGRRNDYGQVIIPDYSQQPSMQTEQGFSDYYSPEESINRAADMIGTGEGTAELMPDDMSRIEIDQKKQEGTPYWDPSAAYNTIMGGIRNLNMAMGRQNANALMYSNMANQFVNTDRQQGAPYDINTGDLARIQDFASGRGADTNFMDYGKRGGTMNKKPKYKSGGTYLLEEDVINKIKQAGGIIKFLD
jgi:DNA-binding transcriptional MerR regulator